MMGPRIIAQLFSDPNLYSGRPLAFSDTNTATQRDLYDLLWLYYLNSALYDELVDTLQVAGYTPVTLKGLRNPAERLVEFYVGAVWPGELPDALKVLPAAKVTNPEQLTADIARIWEWSNWGAKKNLMVRQGTAFGDAYIKVLGSPKQVRMQLLDPRWVPDIETDERGYVVYIRIDIPEVLRDAAGKQSIWTFTEVWEKNAGPVDPDTGRQVGRYRTWRHQKPQEPDLDKLGKPIDDDPITTTFGIDFVPIVHMQCRDIGETYGVGVYTLILDKIDELNRIATRMHDLQYRHNKPTWIVEAGGNDGSGRPIPPVQMPQTATGTPGMGRATMADEEVWSLPGNAKARPAVPELDYTAMLAIVDAMQAEIERDRPELAYQKIRELGADLSGRAVKLLLWDAIKRIEEVIGQFERALVRAHQMALTIGQVYGVFTTWDKDAFEKGLLKHSFEKRDIFPTSRLEEAEAEEKEGQAKLVKQQITEVRYLVEMGYSQADADALIKAADDRAAVAREAMEAAFADGNDTGFEQGDGAL